MSRRLVGTIAALMLTAAGLWWLIASGSLSPVLRGLASADARVLVLGLPLVAVIQLLRACRFVVLLPQMGKSGLLQTFRISCLHVMLNLLLPFKLGEAAFPLLARRMMGIDLAAGTSTLLTVRVLDLGTLFAMLAIAATQALPALASWRWLALPAAALALLVPLALLYLARTAQRLLPKMKVIGDVLERARAQRTFAQVTGLSLLLWSCHAGVAWLAFLALDQPVDVATAVFAGASANLAFALPFQGVAGLGPVQAAFAWAAKTSGVPLDPAIAAALACHATLVVSACLLGLLALASEPRLQWWRRHDLARARS